MASNQEQKAKITLYWLDRSRSHRVLWLLEELGLAYELRTFKRSKDMQAPQELKDVHPLGKSPIISVQVAEDGATPVVIPESGAIVEYLLDHFGPQFVPQRYPEGKEGVTGGETEAWFRYRHLMHYAEGSLMTVLVVALMVLSIREAPVPFFIRPITRSVASKMDTAFVAPNMATNLSFLENQLATAPDGGGFFCGPQLTGADFLMIFPLQAARGRAGLTKEKYPRLVQYVERLEAREAYKRAVKKIEEATGEKFSMSVTD
ncbi:putative glutathione S-transferase [Lineolata rhizophorae]|uniref:Putative glutathione S-transferase n=1 Tax=Lineolata rhizophorae TaxID=578093 RepID=A0A6A6PCR9_9PEZI|nr:putative glutathione S-transferase [Lineolata rhizophorae]